MVHELGKTNSLISQFLAEIRDKEIQKDPLRFRKNMERIGEILGYELSKTLSYKSIRVATPLAIAEAHVLTEQPVIASVLRAGLTLHNGLMQMFDRCENAFISAYREEANGTELKVHVEYLASPDLKGKVLILADPMLATGQSLSLVLEAIKRNGIPKKIHVVCVIASQIGIEKIQQTFPQDTEIWVGAIDPLLNDQAYIIPGIGDAGDLSFGVKL